MEVEEFIKTTLRQVISAVNAIDGENLSNHEVMLARSDGITFDLAVTAESSAQAHGGGALKIHIVQADAGKKSETKESTASRIKFKVYP